MLSKRDEDRNPRIEYVTTVGEMLDALSKFPREARVLVVEHNMPWMSPEPLELDFTLVADELNHGLFYPHNDSLDMQAGIEAVVIYARPPE